MKLGLYMYDDPISLNENSTKEFIEQYDSARELMTTILDMFTDRSTSRETEGSVKGRRL